MKQLFIVAAILLTMTISTSAFAHSQLGGSNPADGDVVTDPLNEIVLEFDGQIEQGSFIDVATTAGQTVDLQEIIIGEGTLTGTLSEPLPNDEYRVNWSIISADGHPLEGEFSFTVNAASPESVEEAPEEPSETKEDEGEKTESVEQSTVDQESANEVEKESSSMTFILIGLLVVIVIGVFFLLAKRRK